MEKVLKDGKLYSLIEFRDRIYEDLDLSKSDLTTLLCAMLIASIGLNMNSIPAIIGAMLIATALMPPVCTVGYSIATGNLEYMVVASYLFSINCSFIMITHILALM